MFYKKVYEIWFQNPDYWMPISEKDKKRVDKILYDSFFTDLSYSYTSKNEKIGYVVYHDQLLRHFQRHNPSLYYNFDEIRNDLLPICSALLSETLSEEELIFVLFPFKHLHHYDIVLEEIIKWKNDELHTYSKLCKFFQDTYQKKYSIDEIRQNIKKAGKGAINFDPMDVCEVYNTPIIQKYVDIAPKSLSIISLSGGVDSMTILSQIPKDHRVIACHLIYGNREESMKEFKIVEEYCDHLGIDLYYYQIEYLKRSEVEREFYERMTRDIRFYFYKCLIGDEMDYGVYLGHIQDDVVENVWTNFAKGQHLFDLKKMSVESIQEGVRIIRPFLNMKKTEILEIARKCQIPYLKNTTPTWSNRGKFRNRFYKETHEQYGDSVDEKIVQVATQLEHVGKIMENLIYKPIYSSFSKNVLCITRAMEAKIGVTEWVEILTHVCHHFLKTNKPRIHAVEQFVERLYHTKTFPIRFQLKKDLDFWIEKEKEEYFLKLNLF